MPDDTQKTESNSGRNVEDIFIPGEGADVTINIFLGANTGGPYGGPTDGRSTPHGGPVVGGGNPHGGNDNGGNPGDSGPQDGPGRPHGGDDERKKRIVINIFSK